MFEFTCNHCGRRLGLDESWAGKICRCSHCRQIVAVPHLTPVGSSVGSGASPAAPPQPAPPAVADLQTIPPSQADSLPGAEQPARAAGHRPDPAELYDFLAPAQTAGEIGRLGGYRVLQVLGSGGMGVVFQAEDLQLRRPVALKAMLPVLAASPTNRQRFLHEAQAAAAIEHDHIVTIYQVGEDRGIPFIAMQLLKGESLEECLQRTGRLSAMETLRIAGQIANGLAVAHERGLIHRDIKPSNIWLEDLVSASSLAGKENLPLTTYHSTRVKILDFGLARSVTAEAHLTKSGAIIGTPAYMAPEQSRGQKLDGRCDLFSLGCVLYRTCTGRMPFGGTDAIAVLLAVASADPMPPHRVDPLVPPRLSRLIMDLLAKDPKLRPHSAWAVIQEIQEIEHALALGRADPLPIAPVKILPRAAFDPSLDSRQELAGDTAYLEPDGNTRKMIKWPVLAIIVGGALLLLVGLVTLAVVLSGNRPDDAMPKPNPRVEMPEKKAHVPTKLFPLGPSRFLSDLEEFDVKPGEWPFTKARLGNPEGSPIQVGGVLSPHGLGMHPPFGGGPTSVKYRLGKEAQRFKAIVAVNDTTNWCWSPAIFTVLGDGEELWKSTDIAHNHTRSQKSQVIVKGVDVLELRVRCHNGNHGVHAVWFEPRVLQTMDSPDPVPP